MTNMNSIGYTLLGVDVDYDLFHDHSMTGVLHYSS